MSYKITKNPFCCAHLRSGGPRRHSALLLQRHLMYFAGDGLTLLVGTTCSNWVLTNTQYGKASDFLSTFSLLRSWPKCGQFWSQKPCFLQLSCVIKVLRDGHRSPIFFYVSRYPPHLSLRRHLLLSYLQTYREKSHFVLSTSAAGSHVWMLTLKLNIVVPQFM